MFDGGIRCVSASEALDGQWVLIQAVLSDGRRYVVIGAQVKLKISPDVGQHVNRDVHVLVVMVILLDDVAIGEFPASLVMACLVIRVAT